MFYSQFILAKKGPLGTIWIAAHLERKLRKNQVADTDIGLSVDSILFPEVPIALRLSSHLLLGVVRIYSKKVNYLFDDCSEALLKVKQAFRSTAVDLPPEQSKAPYHSITLPETFDLDDFEIPDNEITQGNYVDHHVSTREQITLQDTMDGVPFPTSQFGPDERFGDGDAFQIGLDLDEDLFLDKGEAAGTSGVSMDMDADPQTSVKASSPSKVDDHNEGFPNPSLTSPANYVSIQAPSTPGLMEEPNWPSAQKALGSDDHMDEDHNPSELVEKEVSGSPSSQPEPTSFGIVGFHADGNYHHCDEQEPEKAKSLGPEPSTETMELISTNYSQPHPSNEHVEATSGLDATGNDVDSSFVENERSMGGDIQSEVSEVDGVGISKTSMPLPLSLPLPGISPEMEVHSSIPCAGSDEANLNNIYPLMSGTKSENDKASVGFEVPSSAQTNCIVASSGSEPQNGGQSCLSSEISEAFRSNVDKISSAPSMSVLQACNSHVQHACNGVDTVVNLSSIPAEDGRLSLLGSGRENATNVSGVSPEVQDAMKSNLNASQIIHQVTDTNDSYLDGKLDNIISGDNNLEEENDIRISDLPLPEKLLSMPNFSAGQPDDLFVECTPSKGDVLEGHGDATTENILSGRKRSYTESTLTIQSINSAESSGATQSKRSVEFIPDDDDLLSSILAGRKSTTLKMKPTPPVSDTVPAKRQRVTVRASAHKRKVLIDDAMVLHGDTIRQQLTSTEDIHRLRRKAPCTHLEIWMLQKQFLEDEIFIEPVFTGISAALISLRSETLNLSRTKIVEENVSKGANELEASRGAALGEKTECVSTFLPSTGGDYCNQDHRGSQESPSHQELMLGMDSSSLQKKMKTDHEVTKNDSEFHASGERVETEIGDGRIPLDGEAMGPEQESVLGPDSEVNCNSAADAAVDLSYLNQTGDVVSLHIDVSPLEDACGAGIREPEGDVIEGLDSEEKLDTKCLLQESGAAEEAVPREDVHGHYLPVLDANAPESVPLEDGACPTSALVMGECQLDASVPLDHCSLPVHDEILGSDQIHDSCGLTSNNPLGEGLKLDSSCSVDTDLSSQNTLITETEKLECWDTDRKVVMDSTTINTDYIRIGEHADFETDAIEHDTDFLNVDDDEVAEDYECDMHDNEEKRILDNTGWSARTRAVANYLQALFEKEAEYGKDISLNGLLAAKSRKEASRMFFETLVLKTKDYIHAEQESSYHDIRIKSRGKLMKSEF